MSNSAFSPFSRSNVIRRSPPPTPTIPSHQPMDENPSTLKTNSLLDEIIPTSEVQKWMAHIETLVSEVCTIVNEGKMNSDQKLRVSTLCRKVTSTSSQMAVFYQSLKQKAIDVHSTNQHLQEQQDVKNCLQQVKETMEDFKTKENISFANIVKKGASNIIRPSPVSSLAIYPSDKTKSSDETKSLVQKLVSPEELKLHVRGLRKVKNGGVLISAETKGDIEKLRNCEKFATSGLTVEEPTKRRPRISVIGVPVALKETEVFECIYKQNLADKFPNTTQESFMAAVKLSHKSGKKNLSTCNYILEVPANVRKALINQGRIYINWTSCPVKDFTIVTRCFNCQQFGHAAKFCRETSPTCNYCGEQGHAFKDCKNKSSPPNCATCKRFKRKCDHQTGDVTCPARKYAEDNYINSIDYEGV